MSTLEHAIALAARAHEGQIDKAGAPYILHPLRVMLSVRTTEEKIVAVLHDVVEDTPLTLADLRAEGFSEAVVAAVDALSRRAGESFNGYLDRLAVVALARRVKLADLADNSDLGRFAQPGPEDERRRARYQDAIRRLQRPQAAA